MLKSDGFRRFLGCAKRYSFIYEYKGSRLGEECDMSRRFEKSMFDSENRIGVTHSSGYEAVMDHSHDFVEMVYVTSGSGVHLCSGHKQPVVKGDLFIIGCGAEHALVPAGPEQAFEWLNFIIDQAYWAEHFAQLDITQTVNLDGDEEAETLLSLLTQEYAEQSPAFQPVMEGLLTALMGLYARRCDDGADEKSRHKKQENWEELFSRAEAYMRQNYAHRIMLEDIAQEVNISKGYLVRIFRELKATSPIECLNIIRLEQACRLLLLTNKTVEAISGEVGFCDTKFFYVLFKRKIGMTPQAYRLSKKLDAQ